MKKTLFSISCAISLLGASQSNAACQPKASPDAAHPTRATPSVTRHCALSPVDTTTFGLGKNVKLSLILRSVAWHRQHHDRFIQELHPDGRHAFKFKLIAQKPKDALRACVLENILPASFPLATPHLTGLGRQTLVDIFNMMCIVARNIHTDLEGPRYYSGAKLPGLVDDTRVLQSVFVSRAPMRYIAAETPRDEDTR